MKRNLQSTDWADSPQPAKCRRTEFGVKALAPGKDPDVDIIAIHGIDGDREGSWTADNGVLWLRDLLPEKVPNARILTYGYDGNTHDQEHQASDFMHEHAMNFISKLALFRETTGTAGRPIVFVAHGSGGLLLKSALIHGHLCHDDHLRHHLAISQSTHGVAFFGTPHQGSAELHLEKDSEALQQQLVHYSAISGLFETKFFYGTYDTHVAGVSKKIVPRTSAVVLGAVNAEVIGLYKDHTHMIKFPSTDDEDFWTVSTTLSLMSKAACQKVAEKANRYKEAILTPSQQSVLSGLPRVYDARFDASSHPHCLGGTRVNLLNTISEWTDQDISREDRHIFWLCGQAGTGKTTISLTVATSCKAKNHLGASFFFSRDHADRSDLRLVFPTIAYQLGIFHKPFKKSLAEVLEQDPDIVHLDPMHQFGKLIMEPLKSCGSFPASTVVVIDALDECKDENPISRMLSILSSHIHDLPCLKFFITSRPEDHIRGGFDPLSPVTHAVILHNLEASIVDADIERYLRNELSITAQRLYPALVRPGWISDESIKSLVGKSGRLFIFAATAMKFILDRNYSDPSGQLAILLEQSSIVESSSSPFAILDQLYLQVLRQAFPSGTTPPHRLTLLKKLLGVIVLLRDPLSPGALESLLNLRSGEARTTLRHLHSVIDIPATEEQPIRLIHPSFFDFVTSRCSDADFRVDSLECHEHLAIACFKQMKALQRDICRIQDASKLNSEIEDLAPRIERYIPPALQYACRHWSFHLCVAGRSNLQAMLVDFSREQILYWIEALSLLGYLREGICHLQDVSKFLTTFSPPSKDLLEAFSDSTRFMADYFELLSRASLQLYRSALPLSAPSSFLHKNFHRELNGGMRVLRGKWAQKSSGVTGFRGSKGCVRFINFSPDGTLIVSASDNEVRLWDCCTGTLLRKLGARSLVKLARISPDGNQVIAGTTCGTISIWNITTGTSVETIQLEAVNSRDCLKHCDISPDLTRIVGCMSTGEFSFDHYIYIWDASNGDLLQTVKSHSRTVEFVAFSPDHKLIASASYDNIYIWNAVNYTRLRTLKGQTFNSVLSIAFSPDSKYLVTGGSGYENNDIRLCDVNTGATLNTLKGHEDGVNSVKFSPNGACIISGSWDYTLRVWDAIRGTLLRTIKCPGRVGTALISPDGTQYIWSTDQIIYIRDGDSASNPNELDKWEFENIRFTPGGAYITCGSSYGAYVWDGLTGTRLIFPGLKAPITVSPNNKYLASLSSCKHLCLWNMATRTIIWKMSSLHSRHATFITFSSDNTRILLASDPAIEIVDVANGKILFTKSIVCLVSAPTFSDDGSQIIQEKFSRSDIPPHARPLVPCIAVSEPSEQLKYLIEDEWIFSRNGSKKERCVWIPQEWRPQPTNYFLRGNYSSSHGRVAIGTHRGLVLLDLSGIIMSV